MSEQPATHSQSSLLVMRVTAPQVMGDTIADQLRDEFLTRYEQSGAVHAVIDMEQVHYLSSAGIRPLLSLVRKVREREGRLILTNLTPDVEGVFTATRLIGSNRAVPATFENHPDVPSAVASLYHKHETEA